MRLQGLVAGIVILALLAAGCHGGDPPGGETILAGESLQLGDHLFHVTKEQFVAGTDSEGLEPSRGTLSATVTVAPEHDLVGVKLLGDLQTNESRVTLRLVSSANVTAYERVAEVGGQDSYGTIEGFFYILESAQVPAGRYEMRLMGEKRVGHLSITLTGVDMDSPEGRHNETFEVGGDVRSLRITLSGEGWGSHPAGRIVGPDGRSHGLSLAAGQDDEDLIVPASSGTWRMEIDATGFGGFVSLVVRGISD